jgi:hypothetical protein
MKSSHHTNNDNNKTYATPILRRVFSRSSLSVPTSTQKNTASSKTNNAELRRPESRPNTEMSIRSGTSSVAGKSDLVIDVTMEENIQFMDQPLRGKIELSGLPAPIESVAIALRGFVKTCVAGNTAWAAGFGGESNVNARFTEREVTNAKMNVCVDVRF